MRRHNEASCGLQQVYNISMSEKLSQKSLLNQSPLVLMKLGNHSNEGHVIKSLLSSGAIICQEIRHRDKY